MIFEPVLIAEMVLLGLCSGFLAGLLGIGGGMVMVPFITAILSHRGVSVDLSIKMAIATSMSTIIFTSISSVRAHHRRGAVRWDIVRGLAPGIVLGSFVASLGIFAVLKGSALAWIFAGFVGFSALQMLKDKKPKPSRTLPETPGKLAVGGGIGMLSGLVGAGGGFMSVPFMVWCNVAIHNAVATSSALGFPIAVANTAGYVIAGWGLSDLPAGTAGYVYLPALAVLASASVLMAPLGVKAAHAMPVKPLKRVFAYTLFALAAYMFYKGFQG